MYLIRFEYDPNGDPNEIRKFNLLKIESDSDNSLHFDKMIEFKNNIEHLRGIDTIKLFGETYVFKLGGDIYSIENGEIVHIFYMISIEEENNRYLDDLSDFT